MKQVNQYFMGEIAISVCRKYSVNDRNERTLHTPLGVKIVVVACYR